MGCAAAVDGWNGIQMSDSGLCRERPRCGFGVALRLPGEELGQRQLEAGQDIATA